MEKERPETSQPKATPWELSETNIRPEWAKELLFRSLPLPLCSGGLLFFCPLRGRFPAASNFPGRIRSHFGGKSDKMSLEKADTAIHG